MTFCGTDVRRYTSSGVYALGVSLRTHANLIFLAVATAIVLVEEYAVSGTPLIPGYIVKIAVERAKTLTDISIR